MGGIHIKASEWKFLALFSVFLLFLTSLPYAFAAATVPADKQFMGFITNVEDHTQYLSWYKGFEQSFFISNRLTSEPNPPIFFNLLWWTLSKIGQITTLDYAIVYQVFRWMAGAFFLFMTYYFCAFVFQELYQRRLAFLVIALGSGLGWLLVILKYTLANGVLMYPLDLYVAEGNSFLCILGYPHFAEAAGLILAVYVFLLVGERKNNLRYAIYAGLVALFLGFQHGYDLLIVWSIPILYGGLRMILDRKLPLYWIKAMIIVGLLSFPPGLYSFLLTKLDPTWKQVLAQFSNAGVYSPNLFHMLILMGIPLVVAIIYLGFYVYRIIRMRSSVKAIDEIDLFLFVWFVCGWLLTYIPTDFQIHMINSWQFPTCIIAVKGLSEFLTYLNRRYTFKMSSVYTVIALIIIIPTNLYLFTWRFVDLSRYNYPYFMYLDEVRAMKWLEDNVSPDTIIMSSYQTGMYMPGISGRRAFLSHWAQTINFFEKRDIVTRFFKNDMSDTERQEILRKYGIKLVFWGPAEEKIGDFRPSNTDYLSPIYRSENVIIYSVK
jgi:hypothetical protein